MYTQTQNVHTKCQFLVVCVYKIGTFKRFFLNFVCTKPFLCVQILPTFCGKLGQKVGKVATKCTHKPHLYTQKLTFFLKICVYIFIKVGRNPNLFIKLGKMYTQIITFYRHFVCTKQDYITWSNRHEIHHYKFFLFFRRYLEPCLILPRRFLH